MREDKLLCAIFMTDITTEVAIIAQMPVVHVHWPNTDTGLVIAHSSLFQVIAIVSVVCLCV